MVSRPNERIKKGVIKMNKNKEYLVLVSDVVAKQIRIKANSEQDALTKAGSGDWFNNQVEKEDVVDRQAEEVLDE